MRASRRREKLVNFGYWMFSGGVILVTAFSFYFGVGFNPVLSNSMAPAHPVGSVVVTMQVSTEQLKRGDVLKLPVPGGNGQSFIHRVFDLTRSDAVTTVVTKGDRNATPDPTALAILSATAPVVVATLPMLGYLTALTGYLWMQLVLGMVVVSFTALAIARSFGKSQAGNVDKRSRRSNRRYLR